MKVLLVDTNISALPILEALTKKYDVTCIGNNPDDFMPRYGVKFDLIDYSKRDNLQSYIEKNNYSSIIPGCNDVSYETCAQIQHTILSKRIDSYQTIHSIHNKKAFRTLASALKMPIPRLIKDPKKIDYPIIVKPTDSFSGKGVTTINKPSQKNIQKAIQSATVNSRTNSYIIEEFIEGQLFSYSCFLKNKRVKEEFFVEEISTANPFVVDLSRVRNDIPKKLIQGIRRDIEVLANHLDLRDGLVHTQFILRNDNSYIIEITRRCPGDLYSLLIEKATGFPYANAYASSFLPERNSYKKKQANPLVVRYTMSEPENFTFRSIKVKHTVDEIFILEKSGKQLEASPRGRIALAFFNPKQRSTQNKIIDSLKQRKLLPFTKK